MHRKHTNIGIKTKLSFEEYHQFDFGLKESFL